MRATTAFLRPGGTAGVVSALRSSLEASSSDCEGAQLRPAASCGRRARCAGGDDIRQSVGVSRGYG